MVKVHMGDWLKRSLAVMHDRSWHSGKSSFVYANLTRQCIQHHEEAMDMAERHMDRGYME
jgi:hypothetical protein